MAKGSASVQGTSRIERRSESTAESQSTSLILLDGVRCRHLKALGDAGAVMSDPATGNAAKPRKRLLRSRSSSPTDGEVQIETTRARSGAMVVLGGDLIILLATGAAVWAIKSDNSSSAAIVSILTSAFTTIGTMTTAYFGIRAVTNTAQSSMSGQSNDGQPAVPRRPLLPSGGDEPS